MSQNSINGYKVTLASGKVVHLRELKIKHQELAAQAAAPRSNGDMTLFALVSQKELIKLLIYSVNGKVLAGADIEDLDALFSFSEYAQLNQVLSKLAGGGDELGKFQLEVVNSGVN